MNESDLEWCRCEECGESWKETYQHTCSPVDVRRESERKKFLARAQNATNKALADIITKEVLAEKSPWRKSSDDPPPIGENALGYWISERKIRILPFTHLLPPDYWMPIPPLPEADANGS